VQYDVSPLLTVLLNVAIRMLLTRWKRASIPSLCRQLCEQLALRGVDRLEDRRISVVWHAPHCHSNPAARPGVGVGAGHPVTLTTQMPDGVRYQIKISVDDGYLFTVRQSAMNTF